MAVNFRKKEWWKKRGKHRLPRKHQPSLWLNYFRPNAFVEHVDQISVEALKRLGIKLICCDLDNTLVPHFTKIPTKEAVQFVHACQTAGMIFVVVSNNRKQRVKRFCQFLNPDAFIYNAKKPLVVGRILRKIADYHTSIDDVLFIGDQLITDILVANRIGCRSILTMPIVDLVKQRYGLFLSALNKFIYQRLEHQNLLVHLDSVEEEYEIL